MSSTRQDAWSAEEDVLLAEVVLRHIKEGSTQLQAFEEVGKNMNRTSAACGFRWNSFVRKQYKADIAVAKKQRKEKKKPVNILEQKLNRFQEVKETDATAPSIDEVLQSLEAFKMEYNRHVQDNATLLSKITNLQQQLNIKNQQLVEKEQSFHLLQEEYASVLKILDTARKLVVRENI